MYADIEFADSYFTKRGGERLEAWDDLDDVEKQSGLDSAQIALDARYGNIYLGDIFDQEQEELFPRTEFTDNNGRIIPAGQFPIVLKKATCELAIDYLNGEDIFGESEQSGITSESVTVGSISESTSFSDSETNQTNDNPLVYTLMRSILDLTPSIGFYQGTLIKG